MRRSQLGSCSLPRGGEPPRANLWGGYHSATTVFAPARSLDCARDDGARERYVWFYNVFIVDTGIADLPTAARRSLPRDLSTALEMTELNTVPQGWRRDEGVPPYRGGFTPAKVSLYSNGIPSGGRGRPPLPLSIESKYGHRRLARRGSLSGGRGTPLPRSIENRYGHRRLANGGSLPSSTCPQGREASTY